MLVLSVRENQVSVVHKVCMQPLAGFFHLDLDEYIGRIDLALPLYGGIIEAATAHSKRFGRREQGEEVKSRICDDQ